MITIILEKKNMKGFQILTKSNDQNLKSQNVYFKNLEIQISSDSRDLRVQES